MARTSNNYIMEVEIFINFKELGDCNLKKIRLIYNGLSD